jgi:glycosyltransferase involved in cell wall biosynthesis
MQSSPENFVIIKHRYLAVQNIPYFIDGEGRILLERSWHHDLIRHLDYLSAFTLAAPLRPLPSETGNLVRLEEKFRARLNLVSLPSQTSRAKAFIQLPLTFRILWRAIGDADIVHTGNGGWPYPLGWLANFIAQLRGKKRIVIAESSAWRISTKPGSQTPLRKRMEAAIYEGMARHWCSTADLSFYTQPAYLTQFHGNGKAPAYVAPASWVNSEDVLDNAQAEKLWDDKMQVPVRFLFAGRLVAEKGVKILLEAIDKLTAAGVHGAVHIIGDGPLRDEVIAAERNGPFSLKHFNPVPYGAPFLTFLQRYHTVVVPSLSDEQPRIVFDAAARAVPILASDTDGLRPHVDSDHTGRLIPPGNSAALAEAMTSWVDNPNTLRQLGMEALSRVRRKTHLAMHSERSQIIARHFGTG